jgi:THO complex subunit 4
VTKANDSTNGSAARGRGRKARGGRNSRNPRPAKKTAEELDSEMADYFDNGGATTDAGATANGVAQSAANGDAMEDEILVGLPH